MKTFTPSEINFFRKNILQWARENYADFPWRHTVNKWHALVAEIMLQRTKAEQVLPVYEDFAKKFSTPSDFVKDKSARPFASLGLFWREKKFRNLATVLLDTPIPEDRDALLNLPGIGAYISSAFRSLHTGNRDVIIDSNIVRLYGRFFGFTTDGETRRKKWLIELADTITPQKEHRQFNYGLIDHTRSICTPKPRCPICPLRSRCHFYARLEK